MTTPKKIAQVTGGNKGTGLELARNLSLRRRWFQLFPGRLWEVAIPANVRERRDRRR